MTPLADTASPDASSSRIGTCRRCGRAVRETMHTRTAFTVDGFVAHTGPTEATAVRRADSDEVAFVYQRLLRPVRLVVCVRCFADAEVRAAHHDWSYRDD